MPFISSVYGLFEPANYLKQFFNLRRDFIGFNCGFEPADYFTVLIYEKLCEIPFYPSLEAAVASAGGKICI